MDKEEKREFARMLEEFKRIQGVIEAIPVEDPIEQVMELEEYEEIVEDTRSRFREQLEEAGVEEKITYPYKTDILEGNIEYETPDWLVIYGIEILEGIGNMHLCIPCIEFAKIHSKGGGNFILPMSIIMPKLMYFEIQSRDKQTGDNQPLKYRLVGEGNNNPKIEEYVDV